MTEFSKHEGFGELITDETKNLAKDWAQRRIAELSSTKNIEDLAYFEHALEELNSGSPTIHPNMIFSWADAEQKRRDEG